MVSGLSVVFQVPSLETIAAKLLPVGPPICNSIWVPASDVPEITTPLLASAMLMVSTPPTCTNAFEFDFKDATPGTIGAVLSKVKAMKPEAMGLEVAVSEMTTATDLTPSVPTSLNEKSR